MVLVRESSPFDTLTTAVALYKHDHKENIQSDQKIDKPAVFGNVEAVVVDISDYHMPCANLEATILYQCDVW